ncbi:kinase-like protein [Suillus brevipes Sb2]|nr:kinase-like protein [Suillus brevipes Sb2]
MNTSADTTSFAMDTSTADLCPDVIDPVYPPTPTYTFSFTQKATSFAMDTSTADVCPDIPIPSCPPTPTHVFTFEHSGLAEAPQNSPVPHYGFFRVSRTLGKGGFGRAVLAQSIEPNRLFCLKVFQKDQLKKIEDMILDELAVYKRIASSMPCPARNFLMGLEFSFQTKNEICFAMDLMASDLRRYMIDRSSYCHENAPRWTAQMALGICALHDIGIIHRDIKSENILIDIRENVRIADYGLCYIDNDANPLDREQVYSTDAVGTTYTMAPEVLQNVLDPGSTEYGTPVDWWSLGCVVFQLVSADHKADRPSREHPIFNSFHPLMADLLAGLLDIDYSTRHGFDQVVCNEAFVSGFGRTHFSDAYSYAHDREELPESLPQLQHNEPSEVWARLLPWDIQRVPNIDWKPNDEQ